MTIDTVQHKFAYTNGIRMHYVEAGTGPLVLLCHGWPESWYSWRHQIPALAAAGFRVIVPDLRGYGDTEAPASIEEYDILHLASDLVGLVHAVGEDKAILVGHDWGSIIAGPTALLRPDIFHAVAHLSVPFLPRRAVRPLVRFFNLTREKHFYQDYFQQPGRVERELEEDVRRSLLGVLYSASGDCRRSDASFTFASFPKNTRMVDNLAIPEKMPAWLTDADIDFFAAQFRKSGFRGPINFYRNFDRNWLLTPFLDKAKLRQPSIFIAGSLDGVLLMAAEEVKSMEENVPNLSGKHIIDGAGHWIQQERPEEVNKLLVDFAEANRNPRQLFT